MFRSDTLGLLSSVFVLAVVLGVLVFLGVSFRDLLGLRVFASNFVISGARGPGSGGLGEVGFGVSGISRAGGWERFQVLRFELFGEVSAPGLLMI